MNRLEEIVSTKRLEIEQLKQTVIFSETDVKLRPSLGQALLSTELGVICEVKRKSPSAGSINYSADPIEIARLYEQANANAISVLTDAHYFGGSFDFLSRIDQKVNIPLLCKDFILDPVQIQLAAQSGASAVLLITECLNDSDLYNLYEYARFLGLDALVEAHEPENIRRAVELGAPIIGINNRNLKTFDIDIEWGFEQICHIPEDRIRLSLSAYQTRSEAEKAAQSGFDAILIGSTLMKASHTSSAVRQFTQIPVSNSKRPLQIQTKTDFHKKTRIC